LSEIRESGKESQLIDHVLPPTTFGLDGDAGAFPRYSEFFRSGREEYQVLEGRTGSFVDHLVEANFHRVVETLDNGAGIRGDRQDYGRIVVRGAPRGLLYCGAATQEGA